MALDSDVDDTPTVERSTAQILTPGTPDDLVDNGTVDIDAVGAITFTQMRTSTATYLPALSLTVITGYGQSMKHNGNTNQRCTGCSGTTATR
jgi:hypothetical protein